MRMSIRLFPLGPYRALLRLPDAARLVASGLLGRLPAGMAGLSIVLLVQEATGSYAAAGTVAGSYSITIAIAAPFHGRLIDRFGQTRVLIPAALLFGGAFAGLGLAAAAGAPLPALYALAMLAGLTWPALAASIRALWAVIVGRGRGVTLQTAYGFESTVQELIFITGPFLVAVTVRFASPVYALLLGAVLAVVGTTVFATTPTSRDWRPAPRAGRHWAGPMRSGGMRVLVVLGALFGSSIGALEVSVVAFASEQGSRGAAGVLLAIWSTGSMLGGLWFGSRHWSGAVHHRLIVLSWVVAACYLGPLLAGSVPLMGVALVIDGLCIAPLLGTIYLLVDVLALEGTVTESFTWIHTGFISGLAAGTAIAGWVIEALGVRPAIGAAVVGVTLSAIVGTLGRRSLAAERGTGDAAVARAA
jgi:hypothetical protein